jgi:uncharacterized protein
MKLVQHTAMWIALVWAVSFALAEPVSQLKPADYVNDFAQVLDAATVSQLDSLCRQIDQKAHAQIAVVTIHSLDGSDIESYAVSLFQQWGIGNKSTDRGVLILLAIQDHRYRTEVGYGLEAILPDGKVGGFGRETVPLLKQNDYNGAVQLLTSRVAAVIAQDAGVQLTGMPAPAPAEAPEEEQHSGSPVLVILGVLLIVMLIPPLRRLLFWFLLFNMGGGGGWGDGGHGGGFGGGGGGGFGGFGGGSSGGGGASGSW